MAEVTQTEQPSSVQRQFGSIAGRASQTSEPYAQLIFRGANAVDAIGAGDTAILDYSLILPENYLYRCRQMNVQIRQDSASDNRWEPTTLQVQLRVNAQDGGSDQQYQIVVAEGRENDSSAGATIRYFYPGSGRVTGGATDAENGGAMTPDVREVLLYGGDALSFQMVNVSDAGDGPWVARFNFILDQYLIDQENYSPLFYKHPW